jgi:hypothetical protein
MKTITLSRTAAFLCLVLGSLHCSAEVPVYAGKVPLRHGGLVGIECNQRELNLVLGIFFAKTPPPKNGTELWKMEDLVRFNPQSFALEEIFAVERQCKLGSQDFRIQLEGLPGASNSMQLCGAGTGVHAKVWLNDTLRFDEDLHRCNPPVTIPRVVFGWDS